MVMITGSTTVSSCFPKNYYDVNAIHVDVSKKFVPRTPAAIGVIGTSTHGKTTKSEGKSILTTHIPFVHFQNEVKQFYYYFIA